MALAPAYWAMLPWAALAGIGNSVFHPADYSIMNHRVAPPRIGRAFSIHALCGTLGYAAAPIVMVHLTTLMPWRSAMLLAALAGGAVAVLVVLCWPLLSADRAGPAARAGAAPAGSPIAMLLSPTILICFGFFVLLAMPSVGATSFLAPTLDRLFATPLATVAAAITAYLAGSGIGVLAGGILADRTRQHERVVAVGAFAAAMIFLAIGFAAFGAVALTLALGVAGFSAGITMPSRDMLVRGAAAKSTTGKVFGFVYSGYDLGAALAPPLLGFLLDHGLPRAVTPVIAVSLFLVILSALALRKPAPARAAAAGRAPA
jgi:MFS family permease